MHDLDLPRGEEGELVVDRDRVYELNGEDGRTVTAVGAFRVVPEHDLDIDYDTLLDYRIDYEVVGREHDKDVGLFTPHHRGAHAASRAQTGFGIYVVGSRGGGGRSRSHPRVIEEFLRRRNTRASDVRQRQSQPGVGPR